MGLLIIMFIGVLASSAMCSGSEAALFSTSVVKARALAENGGRAAKELLRICENMGDPIAAIVILNNVANIVGSMMIGSQAGDIYGDDNVKYVSALLTFMVILFSEIIPKTLGERYCEAIALYVAIPVRIVTIMLFPLIWLLKHLQRPLFRESEQQLTTNEAEIKLLATIGLNEGVIDAKESELIQKVFDLDNKQACDIMTPRVVITHLDGSRLVSEAAEDIMNSTHSRIIVTDGNRDDVTGVVFKAELLAAIIRGKGDQEISELQRKVRFVPKSMKTVDLLDFFQEQRQHLAVVADEYGGVAGVVTLEDALEVLTGEIMDETDKTANLRRHSKTTRNKIQRIKLFKDTKTGKKQSDSTAP